MKKAIHAIDRALIDLYAIDSEMAATDFLLSPGNQTQSGALIIEKGTSEEDLNIGILLNPKIAEALTQFRTWPAINNPINEIRSLAVATEEVSHFRYFVFHTLQSRAVSELEIEFQGEIDKFLVFYFAMGKIDSPGFDSLFQQFFEKFSFAPDLSEERRHRYEEAHRRAKSFISRLRGPLIEAKTPEAVFQYLRRFYRESGKAKWGFSDWRA